MVPKTVLRRISVTQDRELIIPNVVAFSMANYGGTDIPFTIDGVPTILPQVADSGLPTFTYTYCPGYGAFDVKVSFDFSNGSSIIIVDYLELKQE